MVGVLFVGVFCAVLFAYACTEYLLIHFDVRRRIIVGECGLLTVIAVNVASLAVVWISSAILVTASGQPLHLQAAVIAIGAQLDLVRPADVVLLPRPSARAIRELTQKKRIANSEWRAEPSATRHTLLAIRYSLFAIRYSLFR